MPSSHFSPGLAGDSRDEPRSGERGSGASLGWDHSTSGYACWFLHLVREKRYNAKGKPWWVENVLARAQVSTAELLSKVTAGARAAVGCAEEARSRRSGPPGGVLPKERHRLTKRCKSASDMFATPTW